MALQLKEIFASLLNKTAVLRNQVLYPFDPDFGRTLSTADNLSAGGAGGRARRR
jgi:hypothetical protein